MKKYVFIGLLMLTITGSFSNSAQAAFDIWRVGKATVVATDPGDVVVVLNVAGPCGSSYYHIRRTNVNFAQFQDLVKQAFLWNKTLTFHVIDCAGDRNILSHGWMSN